MGISFNENATLSPGPWAAPLTTLVLGTPHSSQSGGQLFAELCVCFLCPTADDGVSVEFRKLISQAVCVKPTGCARKKQVSHHQSNLWEKVHLPCVLGYRVQQGPPG